MCVRLHIYLSISSTTSWKMHQNHLMPKSCLLFPFFQRIYPLSKIVQFAWTPFLLWLMVYYKNMNFIFTLDRCTSKQIYIHYLTCFRKILNANISLESDILSNLYTRKMSLFITNPFWHKCRHTLNESEMLSQSKSNGGNSFEMRHKKEELRWIYHTYTYMQQHGMRKEEYYFLMRLYVCACVRCSLIALFLCTYQCVSCKHV